MRPDWGQVGLYTLIGDKSGTKWGHIGDVLLKYKKEVFVMITLNINDFVHLEMNDNNVISYQYLNDSVKPLSNKNVEIINVLIKNALQYDSFITSTEIVEKLDENNIKGHDKETVKKALQRIKKEAFWSDAIESSPRGYRIKITRITDNTIDTSINTNVQKSETINSHDTSTSVLPVKSESSSSTEYNDRTAAYLYNFIKNNGRIRTYYYETTLHDVSEVYCPVSLVNKDDNSEAVINIGKLYESAERHRYIISGQIGTGKSLLARSLALEAAKEHKKYGIVPLLFDLSMFPESDQSLFDILKNEYQSYIPDDEPNLAQTMIRLVGHSDFSIHCQKGSLLILFDGLDEIRPELKESFLKKLKEFLRSYGNNSILIFSRPTGKFLEFGSFNVLHINPLSMEQTSRLVNQFLETCDQKGKENFKDSVFKMNGQSYCYRKLISNPLFLSVLSSKFKKNPYRFQNLILNETVESIIRYVTCEDQTNQHPRHSVRSVSTTTLRNELDLFCNYLVTKGIYSFDVEEVDNFYYEIGNHDDSAEDFLDDLCRVYGITKFIDGKYEFIDELIVEYFFVRYVLSHDNNLSSIPSLAEFCLYYSIDNILDMLREMNKRSVAENLYCPLMSNYCENENSYKEFLSNVFHKIYYYVGQGEFAVDNNPSNDVYQHLVKDLDIEQDKSHLHFPAIESFKVRPVYKLSKTNAKKLGKDEGLIDSLYCNKSAVKTLRLKPVGFIYAFNTHNALLKQDDNKEIRNILLSDDFPIRTEFNQALLVCSNIEDGECNF